jgi:hypothetical protein
MQRDALLIDGKKRREKRRTIDVVEVATKR